jgi:dipeptidyl aminopeptidase/acylaminoacyl peptidase
LTSGFQARVLPDGRTLVYVRDDRGVGRMRRAAITADGTIDDTPLFEGEHQPNVRDFDISSDGRLLAYAAVGPNRRLEIYLTALVDVRAQRLVHEGGNLPRFSRDGSHLFYMTGVQDESGQPRGRLMRVAVTSASTIALGAPTEFLREVPNGPLFSTYDVAPAGDRVLMWKLAPAAADDRQRVVLVQNALSMLRR